MMKTLFKKSSKKANKENRTRVKCKDQSELKGQQMKSGRGGQYIQHHDSDEEPMKTDEHLRNNHLRLFLHYFLFLHHC